MNALSWLLYVGNVASNLGKFFGIFCACFAIVSVIVWIMYWTKAEPDSSYEPIIKRPRGPILATVLCLFFGFCSCFAPSQDTIYAVAASQLGEQALKTPLAGKAGQALEAWLDKQIASPKGDDKKKDKDE